jgi:hypothetical protein
MTEQLQLRCGNCAWYAELVVPKELQPPDFTPRGQCYAAPPSVYPVPVPKQSSLALAQSAQQKMDIIPAMLRPIVEEDEGMCGSYAPNKLARAALDEIKAQREAKKGCPDECGCSQDGACQGHKI